MCPALVGCCGLTAALIGWSWMYHVGSCMIYERGAVASCRTVTNYIASQSPSERKTRQPTSTLMMDEEGRSRHGQPTETRREGGSISGTGVALRERVGVGVGAVGQVGEWEWTLVLFMYLSLTPLPTKILR